jgi:hypothetical protein
VLAVLQKEDIKSGSKLSGVEHSTWWGSITKPRHMVVKKPHQ